MVDISVEADGASWNTQSIKKIPTKPSFVAKKRKIEEENILLFIICLTNEK